MRKLVVLALCLVLPVALLVGCKKPAAGGAGETVSPDAMKAKFKSAGTADTAKGGAKKAPEGE